MNIRGQGKKPLNIGNIAFLISTPIVAIFGTAWYVHNHGVTLLEIANFTVMFLLTGLAMTGGYHRYYSHRSYDSSKALQLFYLVFGAAGVENSVLDWAADHRVHHKYVDTDDDPYNILRGGLYAHMLWIFYKDTRSKHEKFKVVPDLMKDPLVRWQYRWYLPLVIIMTFGVPTYVGLIQGRPVGGLLWGGFLRVVVVHHMTFFINSLAHLCGKRPYSLDNSARDSWWLAPLTFGEGYHNFHHAFPADYRNGLKWWQFDMTKWWIGVMSWLGQASRLKRMPELAIMAAKLKVEVATVQENLAATGAPDRMWDKIQWRLQNGRSRLENALTQYHQAKVEYRLRKHQWDEEVREQWAEKIAQYQVEFREAQDRWRQTMRAMNRIPQTSAQGILTLTALFDLLRGRLS